MSPIFLNRLQFKSSALVLFFSVAVSVLLCVSCYVAPEEDIAIDKSDSLALLAILEANRLPWQREAYITGFNDVGRITVLEISGKFLSTIPPEIGDLVELKHLDLSSNSIVSLPPDIEQLTNLNTLIINNNLLEVLPDGLRNVNLTKIDLSNNRITSLPTNINVTHLENLNLASNNIRVLPADFKYLSRLVDFDISKNYLDSLPENINECVALKRLDVSYNNLKDLPGSMTGLPYNYINVGNNKLCFPLGTLTAQENTLMKAWLDANDRDWQDTQYCP